MSTFDNPFDPELRRQPGCVCGRHASQAEHDHAAPLTLQCVPSRAKRSATKAWSPRRSCARVPAGRGAPRLPEVGRRLDRACRALAVLPARDRDRGVRPGRPDREEGPQGRLHPDHLRDADHHGASDGLLCQARPQRRGDQDRRLGGDPRQDAEQGIRRRPHALADAARDHAGRRLDARSPTRCRRSRTSTARRSRSPSSTRTSATRSRGRASSSPCRSTTRCTTISCATTSPSTASIPTPTSRSARCRRPRWSPTCAPTISTASSAPIRSTSAPSTTASASSTCCRRSCGTAIRAAPSRHREEFVTAIAEHLRGAAQGDHRRDRLRHQGGEPQGRSPRRSRRRTISTSR